MIMVDYDDLSLILLGAREMPCIPPLSLRHTSILHSTLKLTSHLNPTKIRKLNFVDGMRENGMDIVGTLMKVRIL